MRDLPASKYRKGGGDRFYPVTLYMILGLRDKKYQNRICQVVYAAGSRGYNAKQPVTRQQRKAAFAFTLCLPRELPGNHNE